MWLNLELRESCGQLLQPGPNSCLGNCVNLHFRLLVACGHRWLNMKHRLSLASHVHNKPVFLVVKVKHLWDICALGPYMFTLYTLNKNGHFLFVRTNMLFRYVSNMTHIHVCFFQSKKRKHIISLVKILLIWIGHLCNKNIYKTKIT